MSIKFICTVKNCGKQYDSISGFNKHKRTKHEWISRNKNRDKNYICDKCNESFSKKIDIIKHLRHEMGTVKSKLVCSFNNCEKTFSSLKTYQLHLNCKHMVDAISHTLHFNTFEEFNKWKREEEEKEKCQFVKRTSTKKRNDTEYSYYCRNGNSERVLQHYYCHRSFHPKISRKGKRNVKNGGSVKIGKVCPTYIKLQGKDNKLVVQYCNTHLFHSNEICKLRLNTDDRAKLAGKLAMGVSFQRILNDIRSSASGTELKRIHMVNKKDLYNIKRDYNLNNLTKRHEIGLLSDELSDELWVEEIEVQSDQNITPLPVIDENIILGSPERMPSSRSLTDEINKKIEIIFSLNNQSNAINEESQKSILIHCDKMISILTNESQTIAIPENSINIKQKRTKRDHFPQLSIHEGNLICNTNEILNAHSHDDHSNYCLPSNLY